MIGHSSNYCPYLGKGFKGTCKGCGIIGHKEAVCPKGKGKGQNLQNTNVVENQSEQHAGFNFGTNGGTDDSTISPKGEPSESPEKHVTFAGDQNHQDHSHGGSFNQDYNQYWDYGSAFAHQNPWGPLMWDGVSTNI